MSFGGFLVNSPFQNLRWATPWARCTVHDALIPITHKAPNAHLGPSRPRARGAPRCGVAKIGPVGPLRAGRLAAVNSRDEAGAVGLAKRLLARRAAAEAIGAQTEELRGDALRRAGLGACLDEARRQEARLPVLLAIASHGLERVESVGVAAHAHRRGQGGREREQALAVRLLRGKGRGAAAAHHASTTGVDPPTLNIEYLVTLGLCSMSAYQRPASEWCAVQSEQIRPLSRTRHGLLCKCCSARPASPLSR